MRSGIIGQASLVAIGLVRLDESDPELGDFVGELRRAETVWVELPGDIHEDPERCFGVGHRTDLSGEVAPDLARIDIDV